ncbi:MAG: hypothetical protein HDR14_09290 [Lachnospiraceae bacterium]|nr:hypothetical protein [Lachnospiraceae bacterium]
MKWLKRTGLALLLLPVIVIGIFILYEIFGMCVNHIATGRQTKQLQVNLKNEIPDIEIINVYSETGNTGPTGNHVDCLSTVVFSTNMEESEIVNRMSAYYEFNDWYCYVYQTEDGNYLFYLNTSAPFVDNIEGH